MCITWRAMSKRSLRLVAGLLLVAAACSSDSATTTTDAVPTTSQTTTTDTTAPDTTAQDTTDAQASESEPVEASAPAPVSFAEVEAEYQGAVDEILAAGRQTMDQFLADDFEALWERLDAVTAAALSVEDLGAGKAQLILQAPLGERTSDRAIQLSPSLRVYGAELEWGEEAIAATVSFNDEQEISGLTLSPQFPLPNDPSAGYESEVSFRLPFDGLWFVFWGGDVELQNYHVVAPDQRHALDLVVWKNGGTHGGDGSANEDYWAYGQRVIAPAGGTVVTVVDGLADNVPQVGSDPVNPAGNHMVIRVADGEYVLIAHMQAGSLVVSEGDTVQPGQELGRVGNSGNTSEPHIHIHLQDRPTFDPSATGLPLEFTSYLVNGEMVEKGDPIADQFVANG